MSLAAFLLVISVLFMSRVAGSFYFAGNVSDNLSHFHDDAACIAAGNLPYSGDFAKCVAGPREVKPDEAAFEYPPFVGLLLGLIGLAAHDMLQFHIYFMGLMFVCYGLMFVLVMNEAELLKRRGGPDRRLAVAAAATLCALAAGPVSMVSFDLVPAVLTLGALVLALRGRAVWPGVLLGFSVAAKGYAVVLVPLFLLLWWKQGGRKKLTAGAAALAATLGVFCAAGFAISPQGFIASFTYHSGRGLEFNSLYSAAMIMIGRDAMHLGKIFSHGSWTLTGGPAADAVSSVSSFIMLAAVVWVTVHFARRAPASSNGNSGIEDSPGAAGYSWGVRWALAVLTAFILFFKVGSPQFMCWLAPLAPLLVLETGGWAAVLLFAAAGHAATLVFPWSWQSYVVRFDRVAAGILLFEKLCLLAMIFRLMWPGKPRK